MADKTGIEWTDATWNPVTGCDKVSPGCDRCYAETLAHRFDGTPQFPNGFRVTLRPERLEIPLRWRRPRRIFVNSMSDLFHDQVPDDYIEKVFAVMACAPRHTFQLLTKRHARMRSLLSDKKFQQSVRARTPYVAIDPHVRVYHSEWPLPNVWLGVSAENQHWADIRIPALLDTPAAVRWVSAEPLLGPTELSAYLRCPDPEGCGPGPCSRCAHPDNAAFPDRLLWSTNAVDWVVVGGESGPGARPMHPDWARSLRDQCRDSATPFLFKQWGEWAPIPQHPAIGRALHAFPDGAHVQRYGKKAAGRKLDGRAWDQYPEAVTHA